LTIRASLPNERSAWASPRSLPIASQSGRMWLVSTNEFEAFTSSTKGRQSMGMGKKVSGVRCQNIHGDAFDLGDILVDLLHEFVGRREWPNVPQSCQEVNLQRLAIEGIIPPDQVNLDAHDRIAKGGTRTDVDRSRKTR
jgi:hypothetical protein